MPAANKSYLQTQSYIEALHEQSALLDIYRLDLAKYGKKQEFTHLEKLFTMSPELVAKHFRYSKIDPESTNPSREYKYALRKLQQANLISSVHATLANGIPLKAEENEKKFKLLFLDIGLLQCALGIDPALFTAATFHQVNAGTLAEQFVGQELLAYADCYLDPHLYFWETEKEGSAQVDFITNFHGKVVPIEVKAGKGKRLTSLYTFLERKAAAPIGLHIATKPLAFKNNVLTVPFYLIKEIPRLLEIT
jgi:predicted AAA+ superfamily ATPase